MHLCLVTEPPGLTQSSELCLFTAFVKRSLKSRGWGARGWSCGICLCFLFLREDLPACPTLTASSTHGSGCGTYLRQPHPAFLEGASLGVMGADMPVFTPVAAVWALHAGQAPGHRGGRGTHQRTCMNPKQKAQDSRAEQNTFS